MKRSIPALVPGIGTNVTMVKAKAKSMSDLVGVQNRIHVATGRARATGPSTFGGSLAFEMPFSEISLSVILSLNFRTIFVQERLPI
jgi:hypothetical protein